MADEVEGLVREQIAYYRAFTPEYDAHVRAERPFCYVGEARKP